MEDRVVPLARKQERRRTFRGPEGKVKEAIAAELDQIGAYYFMPATGGYGNSGVSDFCGCYRGRMFQIEAKANEKLDATALQKSNGTKVTRAGGIAMLVRSKTQAKEAREYLQYGLWKGEPVPEHLLLGED